MKNQLSFLLLSSVVLPLQAFGAAPLVLKKGPLEVALDPEFPRVISYRTPAGGISGQQAPVSAVELNGKAANCRIVSKRVSAEQALYQLDFPSEKIAVEIAVVAGENHVAMNVTRIAEKGAARIRTLAFPGNALLTVSSAAEGASLAACLATNMNDQFGATFREKITPLSGLKPGEKDTGNYLFVSEGKIAAGIGCGNFTDIQRTAWSVSESGGVKSCAAQNPVWEFRMFDDEKPELPWVKVFVTPDANGDNRADWQDAAIVCRRVMPKPLGYEFVKSTVGENVAMDFASGAQQPFLKILDEIKRLYLATDGLGNQVIIKGFSSEGHDSANTDYAGNWNERAGGLKDLNFLLERAGKYNSRIGIHINATEAYPEAQRYKPEILRKDANGNFKPGWSWLDTAHMIDKVQDVRSGQLFTALDAMRKALPKLDFVYVDTYWEHGWPAAKTAKKINSLGLPMYSEGDSCVDPWISWSHWRGTKHTLQRFLWFSDRDLFANDPILRSGRSDDDGFMGWQNRHNFNKSVRNTFVQNLPSKFLKHFELLRWTPGTSAGFSEGVEVVKAGEEVTVTQQGRKLMSWKGGGTEPRLFVPWPPQKPEKCYVWNDAEESCEWQVPPSWKQSGQVWIYQLTDAGRTGETQVPVVNGKVTLKVTKSTPWVVYPNKAPANKAMVWGEGSPVADSGFDSRGFASWKLTGKAKVESDANGNPRLVMDGGDASVSQQISGLKPGKTYAATVWAQATGKSRAVIEVAGKGGRVANFVDQCTVKHSAPNDSRTGSFYQRLRVVFTAAAVKHELVLKGTVAGGTVEFDDVRVVETKVAPEASKHFFWEDFESVETGGYGPFTCCPGERTHLSESNPPYTRDTIRGRYSLKSRDKGQVLRTVPSSLRLKPATKYRVSCQVIGNGRMTATSAGKTVMEIRFPNKPKDEPSAVTGEFSTRQDTESYLALFRDGGDFIAIDDFAVDEIGPASEADLKAEVSSGPSIRDEKIPGMKVLLEERFNKPLGKEWVLTPSKLPGTSIEAKNGALSINGYANTSICADLKPLPAGVTAVESRVDLDGEVGETWGPGMALLWSGGAQLRINLRAPDGRFGVDSTVAPQKITGNLTGGAAMLRIRMDEKSVFAEARCAGEDGWQKLAEFPRDTFAGDPVTLRLGKTHGVEALDDHSDTGAVGTTNYPLLRVYGK